MPKKTKPNPQSAEIISATFARLMQERGSVGAALDALHRNLEAKRSRYDTAKDEWILEDDGPTQVASGKALLSYAIGEPVKRQQILSGRIPDAPLNREQLQDAVLRRIAAKLEQPDLSASELVSLKKALVEVESDAPLAPLNEDQLVAAARRVHGMGGVAEEAVTREDELKALDQKIASLEAARKGLAGSLEGETP